jgi:hypothetical protein
MDAMIRASIPSVPNAPECADDDAHNYLYILGRYSGERGRTAVSGM